MRRISRGDSDAYPVGPNRTGTSESSQPAARASESLQFGINRARANRKPRALGCSAPTPSLSSIATPSSRAARQRNPLSRKDAHAPAAPPPAAHRPGRGRLAIADSAGPALPAHTAAHDLWLRQGLRRRRLSRGCNRGIRADLQTLCNYFRGCGPATVKPCWRIVDGIFSPPSKALESLPHQG